MLHVHKDFQPLRGGGGTARHIHGLARALSDLGCEVRVIAPDAEDITNNYTSYVATPKDFRSHVAWADVVHVHGARSKYAFGAALVSAWLRKPFFYTPHAFYEPHGPINKLSKQVWDRTAETFLVTRCAKAVLLTEYWRGWLNAHGISAKKTVVIPNCIMGSDLKSPGPPADLPGHPAILSVGRLDPVKRIDDVIRALAEPSLIGGVLHIVGKGEQRSALEALAVKTGVADRVHFHGFVDDPGTASMMAGSHAFVLASEQEGLPTVLLEALIARCPIVCSQIPGNLAITKTAAVESTFPVGDIRTLARLLNESVISIVTDEMVEKVRKTYTWEHRAADILAMYANVTSAVTKAGSIL